MKKRAVVCVFPNHTGAEAAVTKLKVAGYSRDEISVLLSRQESTLANPRPKVRVEGVIGLMAIPELGAYVAAGPLLARWTNVGAGGGAGGIAGALIEVGLPEVEARRYEGQVEAGNILVSVHVEGRPEMRDAERLLLSAGAEHVCCAAEAGP
ncbi:MAG: hypothetical protein IPG45_08930 [Deltaproteobacteria bacterium]|nr:hypothetical protein [Deltaproteobacteria bacterium]